MNYLFKKKDPLEKWKGKDKKTVKEFKDDIEKINKSLSSLKLNINDIIDSLIISSKSDIEELQLVLTENSLSHIEAYKSNEMILNLVKLSNITDFNENHILKLRKNIIFSFDFIDFEKFLLFKDETCLFLNMLFQNKNLYLMSLKYCLIKSNYIALDYIFLPNKVNSSMKKEYYFSIFQYLIEDNNMKERYDLNLNSNTLLYDDFLIEFYINLIVYLEDSNYKVDYIINSAKLNSDLFNNLYKIIQILNKVERKNEGLISIKNIYKSENSLDLVSKINHFDKNSDFVYDFFKEIDIFNKNTSTAKTSKSNKIGFDINQFFKFLPIVLFNSLILNEEEFFIIEKYIKTWEKREFDGFKNEITSICMINILKKINIDNNLLCLKIISKGNLSMDSFVSFLIFVKDEKKSINKIIKEMYLLENGYVSSEEITTFELRDIIKSKVSDYFINQHFNNSSFSNKNFGIGGSSKNLIKSGNLLYVFDSYIFSYLNKKNNLFCLEDIIYENIISNSQPNPNKGISKAIQSFAFQSQLNLFLILDKNLNFFINSNFTDSFYLNLSSSLRNFHIKNKITDVKIENLSKEEEIQMGIDDAKEKKQNGKHIFLVLFKKYRLYVLMLHFLEENKYSLDSFGFEEYNELSNEEVIKVLLNKKYRIERVDSVEKYLNMTKDFYLYFNLSEKEFFYIIFQMFMSAEKYTLVKECFLLLSYRIDHNKDYFNILEKCFSYFSNWKLDHTNCELDFNSKEFLNLKRI